MREDRRERESSLTCHRQGLVAGVLVCRRWLSWVDRESQENSGLSVIERERERERDVALGVNAKN